MILDIILIVGGAVVLYLLGTYLLDVARKWLTGMIK